MCQGCLLSFATEKESDFDKYKSLVGILHKDVDWFVEDERKTLMKPLRKDETETMSCDDQRSGILRCSCCGETLKLKSSSKYSRSLSMNGPTPSPRAPLFGSRNEDGGNLDLPHIRYTELKLMSDTESELQEDEDGPIADTNGREDPKAVTMPLLPDSDDINEDARQVRLDRRSLMALYMELDEERSASAVAANNAMAMITRLQAEKAAVQMEALQYQRMMEEQAEYDQEALQVMKDLLFKREEDIKALESELETYREKYGHIKKIGSEICEVDDEDYQDIKSQALSSFGEKSECGSSSGADQNESDRPYERSMEDGGGNSDESSFDFEGERSYLLGLLRNLEEKINTPSDERFDSSEVVVLKNENEGRGNENNKGILTREVSLIRERLRAIEADSGFLKHAAMTLQRGDEGTKLLTEIAQHLRKLRQPAVKSPSSEGTDA
ncbi:hypothetical protein DH2020_042822 [Rehmannia glutinosa]|uniref:GTD-binding domain-containing protein n=1 Tax=Rehmannia glutinosa TaxID=99300 RepID=A0ABR0ULE3_REHGL